jgi:hypothetical protein
MAAPARLRRLLNEEQMMTWSSRIELELTPLLVGPASTVAEPVIVHTPASFAWALWLRAMSVHCGPSLLLGWLGQQ